jgi:adenylylsulfate kinase-like enzyme/glycosyltransferase involved in cell wall biosynthesis
MPHISIVSPVYRAENCVAELCRRLKLAVAPITEDFEIILVEDRGPDNSWAAIQDEARNDSRVRGIRLAKNFGQHRAITAGLDIAKGDWVVVMDCDLQDPPEEIPRLYEKAREGYEIVVAQFEERAESTFRQKVSQSFWAGLSWLAGIPFDYRIGNFRIMSRRVVENFRSYREQLRLLGGITALMGFTTTTLPLRRDERFAGETSYTFKKLLTIAVDIAMAYSDKPLKISVIAGLVISGLAIFAGIIIFVLGLSGLIDVPGWASVMVSLYLIGGLIIANLGVIGYYIGKTFDETKRRPLYVIENTTFDFPVLDTEPRQHVIGRVLWITGLSGAGKSTLAHEVVARLRAAGEAVVMLDGDELREVFGAVVANAQNHGREGRLALAMQYAYLCRVIAAQGLTVVIATISLFREVHSWNRANLPGYFEVYLKVPVEELRRRDPKGIYRRFDAGELTHVAGLDLSIDEPEAADWIVKFVPELSVTVLAEDLLKRLMKGN